LYSGKRASLSMIPGEKIPRYPKNAPRTGEKGTANTPRYTAKLKLGPGKAWRIAKPNKKSRDEICKRLKHVSEVRRRRDFI
jgi:hypothetical protein